VGIIRSTWIQRRILRQALCLEEVNATLSSAILLCLRTEAGSEKHRRNELSARKMAAADLYVMGTRADEYVRVGLGQVPPAMRGDELSATQQHCIVPPLPELKSPHISLQHTREVPTEGTAPKCCDSALERKTPLPFVSLTIHHSRAKAEWDHAQKALTPSTSLWQPHSGRNTPPSTGPSLAYSSTLKIDAVCSSETVYYYQTLRRQIPTALSIGFGRSHCPDALTRNQTERCHSLRTTSK
jgi:hypothetical protein